MASPKSETASREKGSGIQMTSPREAKGESLAGMGEGPGALAPARRGSRRPVVAKTRFGPGTAARSPSLALKYPAFSRFHAGSEPKEREAARKG